METPFTVNPAIVIHKLMLKNLLSCRIDITPEYWEHIHKLFEYYEERIEWNGSENSRNERPS